MKATHSQDDYRRPQEAPTPQPRVVTEFEVRERGVRLRMRVECWPAPTDPSDDEVPLEAGYGHGV